MRDAVPEESRRNAEKRSRTICGPTGDLRAYGSNGRMTWIVARRGEERVRL